VVDGPSECSTLAGRFWPYGARSSFPLIRVTVDPSGLEIGWSFVPARFRRRVPIADVMAVWPVRGLLHRSLWFQTRSRSFDFLVEGLAKEAALLTALECVGLPLQRSLSIDEFQSSGPFPSS
jgi:hypothetical protein